MTLLSIGSSAALLFAAHGGFILFDHDENVVAVQAVGPGNDLCFGTPKLWRPEFTACLEGRMQPITFAEILSAGATEFGWIHPDEELTQPSPAAAKGVTAETAETAAAAAEGAAEVVGGPVTQRRGTSLDAAFGEADDSEGPVGAARWTPTRLGGFVYLLEGHPSIYFELQPRPPLRVAYLTDVEGNWEYFLSCVEISEGLQMVRP